MLRVAKTLVVRVGLAYYFAGMTVLIVGSVAAGLLIAYATVRTIAGV